MSLTFAEALNDRFTQIVVTNADRAPVSTDAPSVSGPTGTVTLPADLADGRYTAAFRVVSHDGHPVQGAIRFTVGTCRHRPRPPRRSPKRPAPPRPARTTLPGGWPPLWSCSSSAGCCCSAGE